MTRFLTVALLISISVSSSAQWNSNTSLNLQVSSLQSGDVIAGATTTGGTFIAFYSSVAGNFEMRVQYLNNLGVKQFGDSGIVINNLPTGSATYVFNAIVDNNNNFIVAYNDQRLGSNGTVINEVTTTGLLPWGINGVYLGPGLSPYPTVLSTGEIAVAWNNSSNRISYQKISTSGVPIWSPAKEVFPIISGRQISRVQLVTHTNGKFGMVFQQRNGTFGSPTPTTLYEQGFDNDGFALWAAPAALSNYVTANSTYYSVLSNGDTTYVGYYANPSSQNRFDAFLQRVNDNGALPWGINGSDFATDPTPYEMAVRVAYAPGSSVIWEVGTFSNTNQTQYGVYVQKFDVVSGLRQLTDNAKMVIGVNSNGEQQKGGLSLYNNSDPMFMYYDVTNHIYATRLNASGDFVWSPTKVLLGGSSPAKLRFNFTTVNRGQAVALWAETRSPSTFDQPYAQNISVNGATGPLPVTLISFSGILINNTVELAWRTQTENNNKGFFLERSQDGSHFADLVFVAAGSISGNSNSELQYRFTDVNPFHGISFYRLRQVDKDGKVTYSKVVLINMKLSGLTLDKIYPDPVRSTLHLLVNSAFNKSLQLSIQDASGRMVSSTTANLVIGINSIMLNVASLASGTYTLQLQDDKGFIAIGQFVKGRGD